MNWLLSGSWSPFMRSKKNLNRTEHRGIMKEKKEEMRKFIDEYRLLLLSHSI